MPSCRYFFEYSRKDTEIFFGLRRRRMVLYVNARPPSPAPGTNTKNFLRLRRSRMILSLNTRIKAGFTRQKRKIIPAAPQAHDFIQTGIFPYGLTGCTQIFYRDRARKDIYIFRCIFTGFNSHNSFFLNCAAGA